MQIPLPKQFSWDECLFFLHRGYPEMLYTITERSIRRAVLIEQIPTLLKIEPIDNHLEIDILSQNSSPSQKDHIRSYVSHWFDLETSLQPFYDLLNQHKSLRSFSRAYLGLRLVGIPDLFEALCWCIIGQQINLTFAHQIKERLVKYCGEQVIYNGEPNYLFPKPSAVLSLSDDELQAMKFSRQKMRYIRLVASEFEEDRLSLPILQALPDFESRKKALTALTGIGPWTANYVLMKTLREPDCIPYGDTGLIAGLKKIGVIEHKNELDKLEAFFDHFVGWKSYLSFYIWRSLYEARDY